MVTLFPSIVLLWFSGLIRGMETDGVVSTIMEILERADVVNQVQEFTHHQSFVQRALAISSSTTSIVFCLSAMYMFLAIDPRRLVFRHQLILFLLSFDLLKACILLMYPSRVLTNFLAYYNTRFCHIIGFFTALAIEGADFAILTFAIHTYLLIFKPSLNVRVGNSRRVEGGLYTYRYYIYGISFIVPIVLASLAFIHDKGYESFVCWCYLPQNPVWYRIVLSWVPRWAIILTIFFCYVSVYFHVIKQIRNLGGVFTTLKKKRIGGDNEKPSFFSALQYFFNAMKDRLFPRLLIPDQDQEKPKQPQTHDHESIKPKPTPLSPNKLGNSFEFNDDEDLSSDDEEFDDVPLDQYDENNIENPGPTSPIIIQGPTLSNTDSNLDNHGTDIHLENLKNFRKRQRVIKKQMKSIFIYPLAYIFVWLFPFILYCTQVNYEQTHGPIYWLNCLGAFMQPFNGFVDSLVFFYRETPWKYTVMNKFKKDHSSKMDILLNKHYSQSYAPGNSVYSQGRSSQGRSFRSQSLYESSISHNTNSRNNSSIHYTQHSLSANLNVDLTRFKYWRRVLNDLRLPFFALPTEGNLNKLQQQYINQRIKNHQEQEPETIDLSNSKLSQKHDFSNVLGGALVEDDFRSNLENFSLNFNNKVSSQPRKTSTTSIPPSNTNTSGPSPTSAHPTSPNRKSSISKSSRSRQFSVDPNEPVIIEGQPYSGATSPGGKRHSVSSTNRKRNSYNSGNLSVKKTSGSLSPNKKLSKGTLESSNESDDEMDFMEFLKKGP